MQQRILWLLIGILALQLAGPAFCQSQARRNISKSPVTAGMRITPAEKPANPPAPASVCPFRDKAASAETPAAAATEPGKAEEFTSCGH